MSTLAVLAAELADRTDEQLAQLFTRRPDAMRPPVGTFADLASRLSAAHSINVALDQLILPALLSLHPEYSQHSRPWMPELYELALVAHAPRGEDDGVPGRLLPLTAVNLALRAGSGQAAPGQQTPGPQAVIGLGENGAFPALPPTPEVFLVKPGLRDNAAGSAIETLLRSMTNLLERIHRSPLEALRGGGLGVRTLAALSRTLDTEEAQLCFHLELAVMAQLISLDKKSRRWLATADEWLLLDRSAQWLTVAQAWLGSDRRIGGRPLAPVAPGTLPGTPHPDFAPAMRRRLHWALLELADGVPAAPSLNSVVELLAWRHPRHSPGYSARIPEILREMELLGITGAGAPSGPGQALGRDSPTAASAAVSALLPDPIEHFVLQGDMTAIAPGYLAPSIATLLKRMSVPEGQGTAGIFRFSQTSLEGARAAGMDGQSIRAFLEKHSSTAVPQSLDYLISAAARRLEAQGGPTATTVRGSKQPTPASGVVPTRPAPGGPAGLRPETNMDAEIAAQISRLRSEPARGGQDGESGPALVMEELRRAIKTGCEVWVQAVDGAGSMERMRLQPLSLEAGTLRTRLPGTTGQRRFSIHRLVAAEAVQPGQHTEGRHG